MALSLCSITLLSVWIPISQGLFCFTERSLLSVSFRTFAYSFRALYVLPTRGAKIKTLLSNVNVSIKNVMNGHMNFNFYKIAKMQIILIMYFNNIFHSITSINDTWFYLHYSMVNFFALACIQWRNVSQWEAVRAVWLIAVTLVVRHSWAEFIRGQGG